MFNHPVIMMIPVLVFLALAVWLMPKIFRFVKRGFQALRDRMRAVKPASPHRPTLQPCQHELKQ
jgi:hypothetical protein